MQLYQEQSQQQQFPPQQQLNGPTYYNHPYGSHPRVEGKPPLVPRPALNYIPKLKSQTLNTATLTTTTNTFSNHLTHLQQLQQQSQTSYTSIPNSNKFIQTTDSSYDTPPDMLSPPVPPRRQPQATTPPALTSSNGGGGCGVSTNLLSNAVAATAAAVTAGITRLERNCWQDYAETQLLQNDSLRSSASSSSNTSNSSSSSASFVTAASRFSLYQSSPPGCEPPVPAPRIKKDKDKEVYFSNKTLLQHSNVFR